MWYFTPNKSHGSCKWQCNLKKIHLHVPHVFQGRIIVPTDDSPGYIPKTHLIFGMTGKMRLKGRKAPPDPTTSWKKTGPSLGLFTLNIWLVVSTPLKNISQNGNLPQVGVKIKNIWNHHLDMILQFLEMKKKHRHVLAHTVFATKPTSEEKIARVTTWISPSGVEVILAIASAATQDHDMSSWHQNTGWKSILQSHIYIPGCLWK